MVLATLSFVASAQKSAITIYIKAIGGMYDMGDMKTYLELAAAQNTSNGRPTSVASEFPFSVQAEVGLDFETKRNFAFGPWVNYTQAKGELTYSSSINAAPETIGYYLTRFSAGARVSKNVYKDLGIYSKLGFNAVALEVTSSGAKYVTNGAMFELGCQWKYVYRRFKLITNFGYEVGLGGVLRDNESYDSDLTNTQDEPVKANWNGLRIGMGIGFSLTKNRKTKTKKNNKNPFIPKTIEID